ncbi:MAG: hypothetical protein ACRD0C_24275 [Acidimicrobiia bacterium]
MVALAFAVAVVGTLSAAAPLLAAGGYRPAERRCGFADPEITESSGVASASWDGDVIWTHNDSGDRPRFFAVDSSNCATLATYDVSGATAVDWEDMARSGGTLHFGDIGDNPSRRASVTVYEVPEPPRGTQSGPVPPAATRVLTYPDGAHDAETLLVDPTTGRLVIVTKNATGTVAAYRAPPEGNGVMEKVADLRLPGPPTGGDATAGRIVVRTYTGAFEWDVGRGDTVAAALARPPAPIVLPATPQGEAIAYTGDGRGLWTTSESRGGPVDHLPGPEVPVPPVPELLLPALAVIAAGLVAGALVRLRRRNLGAAR